MSDYFKTNSPLNNEALLVDLNSGQHRHHDFLHADFYCKPAFVSLLIRPHKLKPYIELDFRKLLSCPDNIVIK